MCKPAGLTIPTERIALLTARLMLSRSRWCRRTTPLRGSFDGFEEGKTHSNIYTFTLIVKCSHYPARRAGCKWRSILEVEYDKSNGKRSLERMRESTFVGFIRREPGG